MKKFDIPEQYRSPIITKIKAKRKLEDPRKKDFSPTIIQFGTFRFIIARHFGFCYGVENAIEKAYQIVNEHPEKKIFLLSEMIHNPLVNKDLEELGIRFIQDTHGNQLISWEEVSIDDIVIIPAFGATIETFELLKNKGVNVEIYNTTCPFVEKVWNRSASLGMEGHTVIIHGKAEHEETKATFSHASKNAPAIIIRDIDEAQLLCHFIEDETDADAIQSQFQGRYSEGFDPNIHLNKVGVVNQTTMLASETQMISELLSASLIKKYGIDQINKHYANTRDTLCYATNDNQTATLKLLDYNADLAIVIGGYNSSNTGHIVELLEEKFTTYFVRQSEDIESDYIRSFDIHDKITKDHNNYMPNKEEISIIITSGASCPDAVVEGVIKKLLELNKIEVSIEEID